MKSSGQTPEEAVRIEAFILSEKAGHPAGMETYFWREAELIVAGRTSAGSEKSGPPKRLSVKAKSKAQAGASKPADDGKKKRKKKA
jgi:hypothetical protein